MLKQLTQPTEGKTKLEPVAGAPVDDSGTRIVPISTVTIDEIKARKEGQPPDGQMQQQEIPGFKNMTTPPEPKSTVFSVVETNLSKAKRNIELLHQLTNEITGLHGQVDGTEYDPVEAPKGQSLGTLQDFSNEQLADMIAAIQEIRKAH